MQGEIPLSRRTGRKPAWALLLRKGAPKMATRIYSRLRNRSQMTLDVEMLLARYPRLDERELARLIETFPLLLLFDRAVITADETLSDNPAAFYRVHHRELAVPIAFLFVR